MNHLTDIPFKVIRGEVIIIAGKNLHELYRAFPLKGEKVEICSPREALDFIKNREADIILLDCSSGVEQGLDILRQLKDAKPGTPIIFLTDNKAYEVAVKAFRAGARDFVGKPVSLLELRIMLQHLLQIKRVTSERRIRLDISEGPENGEFSQSATTAKPAFILRAIRYIERNLANKITLEELAEEANLSKFHFCRLFFQHTGMTPLQFTVFMRIQQAKELLKREKPNISTIAMEVGFNDLGTFIRQFKKHAGVTPRTFRNLFKEEV